MMQALAAVLFIIMGDFSLQSSRKPSSIFGFKISYMVTSYMVIAVYWSVLVKTEVRFFLNKDNIEMWKI